MLRLDTIDDMIVAIKEIILELLETDKDYYISLNGLELLELIDNLRKLKLIEEKTKPLELMDVYKKCKKRLEFEINDTVAFMSNIDDDTNLDEIEGYIGEINSIIMIMKNISGIYMQK